VEILFLFHGMEFGLLRFWEVMTQLVTWRSSWRFRSASSRGRQSAGPL